MSQSFKRLHSSLRLRVERKNVFQKLTAVGLDSKYKLTRYHATAPDRFEKTTSEVLAYDPSIFPLYKGYAVGSENREVYKAGGKTVWARLIKLSFVVVPLVIFGVWQLTHFFGKDSGLATHAKSTVDGAEAGQSRPAFDSPRAVMATAATEVPPVAPGPAYGKMTDGEAYVFHLSDGARPRLAGVVSMPGQPPRGVVEWSNGGVVSERLTLAQIRELGVKVDVHGYGVRLSVGKDSRIVTAWPLDVPPPAAPSEDDERDSRTARAPVHAVDGGYPSRPTARAYVPPELVPHEPLTSGRGFGG